MSEYLRACVILCRRVRVFARVSCVSEACASGVRVWVWVWVSGGRACPCVRGAGVSECCAEHAHRQTWEALIGTFRIL